MHHPGIDAALAAVGNHSESDALQKLFAEMKINETDLRKHPFKLVELRFWSDEARGLQMEFEDAGLRTHIPNHDLGDGPWVLTNFVYWGARKNKPAYGGPLPFGLDFSMSRDKVREVLHRHGLGVAAVMGFSGDVDMWDLTSGELTVDFSALNDGIRCVAIGVPIDRTDQE
jgi:hypothetical protein